MTDSWFMDPKSMALIAGAAIQLVITVWQSRATTATVQDLSRWRLEVVGTLAALETRADNQDTENERRDAEINRLRDEHRKH